MEDMAIDPVLCRRSIRKFKQQGLQDSILRRLLSAAMCAPSADDERPWHFAVIQDKLSKKDLSEAWPLAHAVAEAPAVIVVCGDESLQKQQGCWLLDCSAATENILIEAQYLGLGAVWLGVYPVEGRIQRVRSLLNAPRSIIPFALVPVGYPGETRESHSRYDEKRVHGARW